MFFIGVITGIGISVILLELYICWNEGKDIIESEKHQTIYSLWL